MHYPQLTSVLPLLLLSTTTNVVNAIRRHPSDLFVHDGNQNVEDGIVDGRRLNDEHLHEHEHDEEMNQIKRQTIESKMNLNQNEQQRRKMNTLPKPSDHLITDLPYLAPNTLKTKQYAGHISASLTDDKKLFYWLFEPDFTDSDVDQNSLDVPLLIWLNGGPGCSSMDGLFLENGPLQLRKDAKTKEWSFNLNPYSWHKAPAYTLYIDQPVGTGLSFTKKKKFCKNDLEVNQDFHLFLENFMIMYQDFFLKDDDSGSDSGDNTNTQRTMKRPLYFSGESHAGHYIPSMMDHILQRNDDTSKKTKPRVKFNLAGAAIGNGWIDPYHQYAAADLAYAIGSIDSAQKQALDEKEAQCRVQLEKGKYNHRSCFGLLDDIIDDSDGKYGKSTLSIYDNRIWEVAGQAREFPKGHKDVEAYLGGRNQGSFGMKVDYLDVLKALHAEESIGADQRYKECTDPPYNALSHQDGLGVTDEVVRILDHSTKPKLLIFNGMNDMICNHIGNEKALDNLKWKHAKDWTLSKRHVWDYKSQFIQQSTVGPAGYYKEYDNLIFLKVASSGHMVPMDLPDLALDMMRKLLFHISFGSNSQNIGGHLPKDKDCDSSATPSNSKLGSNEHESAEEAEDQSRKLFSRTFVQGGWFGAVMGVGVMMMINMWKSRSRTSEFDLVRVSQNDEDIFPYSDDAEMELVNSPRNLER
jgi:carboxypeptidase D